MKQYRARRKYEFDLSLLLDPLAAVLLSQPKYQDDAQLYSLCLAVCLYIDDDEIVQFCRERGWCFYHPVFWASW